MALNAAEARSSATIEDPLERLVFECLQRFDSEGEAALEALCAEHADRAAELRAEIDKLRRIGMLGPRAAGSEFPERLGDFRLLAHLGSGGMGVVFEAEQLSLGRRVALKLIRPENLYFPGSRERFRREIEAAARLAHPGIVPIHAVGEDRGLPYFAMELVEGCTLADVLAELQGRAPEQVSGRELAAAIRSCARVAHGESAAPRELEHESLVRIAIRIALQVAEALARAHAHGVVHRDVKPANIVLSSDGRAMLLDFGLAATTGSPRLTRSGSQPGSLPYMSPEQLRGEREVDARTDVYSLAATLYEMLALSPPFASASSEELRRAILGGQKAPLRSRNRHLPRDVETVCLAAMELDPARRYGSAAAFARDLANLLALRPIEARRIGPVLRLRRWCQRHPAPAASSGLLAAGALALGVLGLWRGHDERARLAEMLAEARALGQSGRFDQALERTGAALGIRPGDREALALRERWLTAVRDGAEQRLAEILRLSDSRRLQDLLARAEDLWPAHPEIAPALEAWLEEARALRENLPAHRGDLLELEGSTRSGDTAELWRRDLLRQLVSGLEELPGAIARLDERLAFALSVEERTVSGSEARARWDEAASDVARLEVYRGLSLRPQLGLLPLWRDSESGLWEFLHVQSGLAPRRDPDTGRAAIGPESGIVLVLVPGGRFAMGSWPVSEEHPLGSPNADPGHRMHESPVHDVELAAFFLSRCEMTQGQWLRLAGRNPSVNRLASGDVLLLPVDYVSWLDCVQVLERAGLALPTEAQWEYACRAGTTAVFCTGDEPESLLGYANVAEESFLPVDASQAAPVPHRYAFRGGLSDGFVHSAPVGGFLPNAFGLHDMHGNVWEWCRDAVPGDPRDDALPPRAGDGLRPYPEGRDRCSRGGSFEHAAYLARSACRSSNMEDSRRPVQGVRPARPLDP